MRIKERMDRFGKSWGMTVLVLFTASLILAANSVYMAERLVEMSLNREYVHYMTVQERDGTGEQPYNDGIYRSGETAAVTDYCEDSI